MSGFVIIYAPGRGLAEPVRFLLDYVGERWVEESLRSPAQLQALKASGRLPFGQVPVYEIDGLSLAETPAVLRHIARTRGLYGATAQEAVQADMLVERVIGFRSKLAFQPFNPDPEAALRSLLGEVPAALEPLERWLGSLGSAPGFAVGSGRTYADLVLYDAMRWLLEHDPDALEGRPNIGRVVASVGAESRTSAFYDSPRHFPPPDRAYVALMMWVMGFGPRPEGVDDAPVESGVGVDEP